jgi:hypothetical protein
MVKVSMAFITYRKDVWGITGSGTAPGILTSAADAVLREINAPLALFPGKGLPGGGVVVSEQEKRPILPLPSPIRDALSTSHRFYLHS